MIKHTFEKLRFEKIGDIHYKVFDRKDKYIADIKKIYQGSYFYWVAMPVPCVCDGQFYYNLAYTKNQLTELAKFISMRYSEELTKKGKEDIK